MSPASHLRRGWRDPLPPSPSASHPHVRYSPLEGRGPGAAQIDLMDDTRFGYNALMLAAQYDHQDMARMLLDAGANPDLLTSVGKPPKNNNWSNVMVAAWYGDQEVRAPSSSCRLRLALSVVSTARRR